MQIMQYDVIIIGAGAVGSSIARELSRYDLKICVLEKESDVCCGTSMANSAVVHSGYDPSFGSLKAKLNVRGNRLIKELSKELHFKYQVAGSLTVGFNDEDLKTIKELKRNGDLNGAETRILMHDEILKMEPNINPDVYCALYAPTCGVIDPFDYTIALMENAIQNGVKLCLNKEVTGIKKENGIFHVKANDELFTSKIVINAAGLYSDVVSRMIGCNDYVIKPKRGVYFILDKDAPFKVNHVIFPVPGFKGKGVLIIPATSGNFLIGPSANYVNEKDDLATTQEEFDYVRKEAERLIKNIPYAKTIKNFAGNRASSACGDFMIYEDKKTECFYHVSGIDSPGLASSAAIGEYVAGLLAKKFPLKLKDDFICQRDPILRLNDLSWDEKCEYYKKDPRFAHIVCRCENISEGEIIAVLKRPIPVTTLKAIKNRLRVGFGRCQGGICENRVVKILAKEAGIKETEVKYNAGNSFILLERLYKEKNERI